MTGIRICGTGRAVPERVVTNEDFAAFLDTSDEWIRTRTGMQRRHLAKDEAVWQLGAAAAREALKAAGVAASEIDMLLVTTVTPAFSYPSTACVIQGEIGAENAFAFDISAACAGLTYALDMARRYLSAGDVRRVLIVSAEVLSQTADYTDRSTCVLFGDGAGACVVEAAEGAVFGSYLHSDAGGAQYLYSTIPRRELPFFAGEETVVQEPFGIARQGSAVMNGREVYKFATRAMPLAVERACARAGVGVEEIDLLIPHQANLRIIETAVKNLGIPEEKVYVNIQEYGNTSSASISIGLDECVRSGKLRRGDLLCVVGFGAGLIYGACALEY